VRPIIEQAAEDFVGRVTTEEIGDPSAPLVSGLGVRGTPTLIAFHEGREVARLTGSASNSDVRALYQSAATGGRRRAVLSTQDRVLRIGAGVALSVWGLLAATPLLTGVGLVTLFFGTYDLMLGRAGG
jgi:hypothetical protein